MYDSKKTLWLYEELDLKILIKAVQTLPEEAKLLTPDSVKKKILVKS